MHSIATIYECNIEDLKHELHQMRTILEKKVASGVENPSNIVELTKIMVPFEEEFHEVFRVKQNFHFHIGEYCLL